MKRHSETSIDHNVMEGLKLIRFTASHLMKKIESRLPKEYLVNSESILLDTLAKLPKLMSGVTENNNGDFAKKDFENSITRALDLNSTELKVFIDQYFSNVTNNIAHYKLKQRKLQWYGVRVRKNKCVDVLGFVSERPTVYRNLTIYCDKQNDQIFFIFREQKPCQMKKLERLLRLDIELYNIKPGIMMPRRQDIILKSVLIHYFVKGVTMTKPGWFYALRKFKEAVLRAKIKDVNLPRLDEKTEKEISIILHFFNFIGNIIKVEHHLTDPDKRTYIPVRNDKLNVVHSKLGYMKNYSKKVDLDGTDKDQERNYADDGEVDEAELDRRFNDDGLTFKDPILNNQVPSEDQEQ